MPSAERVPHTLHRIVHVHREIVGIPILPHGLMRHHKIIHNLPMVPNRENAIVNRLNKTKVERVVDHEAEQIEGVKRENGVKRAPAACQGTLSQSHMASPFIAWLNPAEKSRPRARRGPKGGESRSFVRLVPERGSRRIRGIENDV